MTGWRIGWMVVPEDMRRSIECLTQNLYISTPALSQLAALAAFDAHKELRENVAAYARRSSKSWRSCRTTATRRASG